MMLRIDRGITRPEPVTILVNGEPVKAYPGESVAAALAAAGRLMLRSSASGGARGAFCFMGACQECLLLVDGRRALGCLERVRQGMVLVVGRTT